MATPNYEAPKKKGLYIVIALALIIAAAVITALIIGFSSNGGSDPSPDVDPDPEDPEDDHPVQYKRFMMNHVGDIEGTIMNITIVADLEGGSLAYMLHNTETDELSGTYSQDSAVWALGDICVPRLMKTDDHYAGAITIDDSLEPIDEMDYNDGKCKVYKLFDFEVCVDKGLIRFLCIDDKGLQCTEYSSHVLLEEGDALFDMDAHCPEHQKPVFVHDHTTENYDQVHVHLLHEVLYYVESGVNKLFHEVDGTFYRFEYTDSSCTSGPSGEPENFHNQFIWIQVPEGAINTGTTKDVDGVECTVFEEGGHEFCVLDGVLYQSCGFTTCLDYHNHAELDPRTPVFDIPSHC
ncbi:hypothetical protein P9112_013781 [Eukaryota sp. TZLM1-RC]